MDELLKAYMPHGGCFGWDPWVFWPLVVGQVGTVLAYLVIPGFVAWHALRRPLHPWPERIPLATFVLACGVSHILALSNLWAGRYALEALWMPITALVSLWACMRLARWVLRDNDKALAEAVETVERAHAAQELSPDLQARLALALEQRRKERRQWALVQEILRGLPRASFFVLDGEGVVEAAGGETLIEAGYEPDDLVGVPIWDSLPGGKESPFGRAYLQALSGVSSEVDHRGHRVIFRPREGGGARALAIKVEVFDV